MEMMTEDEEVTTTLLTNLLASLEQANIMAKKLPYTTDPTRITQIHSTLHSAHHSLSLYLAHHSLRHLPAPFEPMDDDEDEDIGSVEEIMRGCSIQNKRLKRRLSPESAVEGEQEEVRRRVATEESGVRGGFDPVGTKLKALDLIHQFHG